MLSRFALKFLFVFLITSVVVGPSSALAQQVGATVRGLVDDPDEAVIPGATVTLTPASGKALTTISGADGSYTLRGVPAGTYSVTVTMKGFASFVKQGVRVSAGQALTVDAKLAIQTQSEEVQVSTTNSTLSVDQDSNASSTTIKGKDLDALSDDPDELSSELSALAGPAAGPNGGQIYVDGFTGGQLPPKSSIREIRVNQNPFSAQYERLGYGRVEVFTKPGTDKFHGSFQANGNSSAFNTGNPFVTSQSPYHTVFLLGNITGPISSKASFALSGSHRAIQDNAVVNGTILANPATPRVLCGPGDPSCVSTPYSTTSIFPQNRTDLSPRIDLALGEKNTLTARFQLQRSDLTNDGVGGFDLPETAYNASSSEYELQVSDTQILLPKVINETRIELGRNRDSQVPQSVTPSINVSGSFSAGGSNVGTASSREARLELQNYTSIQLAKNFIRFGGRLRLNRESSYTTSGVNGNFTYSSLADYQAGKLGQFNLTKVNNGVAVTLADVGLYLEDDWKVRPNLSMSFGARYETQNNLSGNQAIAPRVSFAYGLGSSKGAPKTVLRGGFGMFYDRFNITNVLKTVTSDGINQQQLILRNPSLTNPGCSPSNIAACGTPTLSTTTTYKSSPDLRTPYTMQFAIGADQQLFKGATLSVNYLNARGVHQFISQNVSYVAGGPVAGVPAQYQYQSIGVYRQNQIITNFSFRAPKYYSLFGYYVVNFAKANSLGANSFPTVPGNISADYGRAVFDTRNRLFIGGSITLPYRITVSPFIVAQSGNPYNVTLGNDQNGDTLFNDRPAFKPGTNSASCLDATSFGVPAAGVTNYTEIPINYCTGPALFTTNLRVAKLFGFGPLISKPSGPDGGGPGPGGPLGGGNRGGGGGRGGGGFGGGGGNSGHRYNLSLGAQFQNLFNTENLNTPNGVLRSPLFGKSTQLAGNIYSSNSAVQRIQLQASFNF